MRVVVSCSSALLLVAGALFLSGCSGAPGRISGEERAAAPIVYGNGGDISSAGQGGWTTPPAGGSVQPAPVPVTSTWSAPPAPPAPTSAAPIVSATPYTTTYVPSATSYATQPYCAPPPAAPARCWSGCGLPCSDGLSQWHVRGVLGYAFYEGDDPASECLYWGFDVGRTFCGCWGLDLFYRYHSGQFPREDSAITEDGGSFHHVGVKATYESSFGRSRFYWYAGVGPEFFWTEDFINDDEGFGTFAEVGVGYVINQTFRVRAGLDFHAIDTDVGRRNPADDGDSRWLYVIAPVIGIEIAF